MDRTAELARLEALGEITGQGLARLDTQAGTLLLGARAQDATGIDESSCSLEEFRDRVHAEDRAGLDRALKLHLDEGIPLSVRLRFRLPDGGTRTQDINAQTVRSPDGTPMFIYLAFPDQRLPHTSAELQELLVRHQSALLQAARLSSLGQMAGGLAHEVNNPLGTIVAWTQQLEHLHGTGKLDAEALGRGISRILRASERIVRIVQGFRTISRDTTQDPFSTQRVLAILDEALAFCGERLKARSIEFQVLQGAGGADVELQCRPAQLTQVFLSLIQNSVDAIQHQQNPWIRVEVQAGDREVELRFVDSGSGIPREIRDRIMTPFFTTKEAGLGTGLGLSLALSMVEDHGGTLLIDEAAPNTTFVVRLPLKQKPRTYGLL